MSECVKIESLDVEDVMDYVFHHYGSQFAHVVFSVDGFETKINTFAFFPGHNLKIFKVLYLNHLHCMFTTFFFHLPR